MISLFPPNHLPLNLFGFALLLAYVLASITLFAVFTAVYNVLFHPLKHIPGPLFARATGIPYSLRLRDGDILKWIKKQHEIYGDAVRVAPNEVSFISGETAWSDIYGFRIGKHKNTGPYLKDRDWYPTPIEGGWSIISSDEEEHSRMRRSLSHAFSDKALREQEGLITSYVDLLIQRLSEHASEDRDIDIMSWYNYTTFDIITDLAFGEPLYCLRDSAYHRWVDLVFSAIKSTGLDSVRRKFILFKYYDAICSLFYDTTAHLRDNTELYFKASEKVAERLEKNDKKGDIVKPDFFTHILRNQGSEAKKLTRDEMNNNAVVFLVAGSETTATTLSGATFLLLRNRTTYDKLVREIRQAFPSSSAVTLEEAGKLKYISAVFQEALRYYPPAPTGFPRVVPPGGDHISGVYVSGGTSVYVSQHAANHSERNFKSPEKFVPERWLGETEEFNEDKKDVWNAFSFGPRNCLGKNLAYAEMRLILIKILVEFDLELVEKEKDWIGEQKVFSMWEKDELVVKLKPVQR